MTITRKHKESRICKTCPNNIFDRNENARFCLDCASTKKKLAQVKCQSMKRRGFVSRLTMLRYGKLFKHYGIKIVKEETI